MVVIDAHYRIVLASPAVTTLFGYGVDELLGQSIDLLVPGSQKEYTSNTFDASSRRPILEKWALASISPGSVATAWSYRLT